MSDWKEYETKLLKAYIRDYDPEYADAKARAVTNILRRACDPKAAAEYLESIEPAEEK